MFEFFYNLFRNFLARVEYERNSELKFCFFLFFFCFLFFVFFLFIFYFFSGRSRPVLAKNIAGKRFHYCLNFFTIFSRNFLSRVEYKRNAGVKFCFPIFGLSHPILAKNNAGKRFYNLLNFLLFFSQFSCPGRISTAFGTNILFSLFRPILSHFG